MSSDGGIMFRLLRVRAFTLIEMLIVIAIIMTLAAIVTPITSRALQRAREVTCTNNLRQFGQALNMYSDEHNGFLPNADSTYYGTQQQLVEALDDMIPRETEVWYCPRYTKVDGVSGRTLMQTYDIGYFYWAFDDLNGTPAPIRISERATVWDDQGWNTNEYGTVLMSDRYRDKSYWPIDEDWQYHGGTSHEIPLSLPGTLVVVSDGSVHKMAPRP
ncbi:MAG: type II secretion system GspH family protein [Verrucomicrobia bacterium]|nr:type II secretion system GspH family protein [Verrucomicrobiota bacterium]